jgi:NitT/TauT family transport system substrate-binding protein
VLRDRPAAAAHFIAALRETLDWMYSDPAAMQMYADMIGMPVDVVKAAIDKYQPKEAKQFDHILDVDGMMADAVRNKFLDAALTKEQLSDLIQITPPRIPPPCGPAGPGSHAC